MKKYILILLLSIACSSPNESNQMFDDVWQTINDSYPESTFNGKDWNEIGEDYKKRYRLAETIEDKVDVLNQMLFELDVSHSYIGKVSEIKTKASPYMFRSAMPGIDIRIIDNRVVVVETQKGSKAEKEGLLPGIIISSINGLSCDSILAKAPIFPPYNKRYKKFLQTEEIVRQLYGEISDTINIAYVDNFGNQQECELGLLERKNKIQLSPLLPKIYLEVESELLKENIGYLRFNAFQPEYPDQIMTALASLYNTRGLILDLRGNNGGSLEAQRFIASRFFVDTLPGIIVQSRDAVDTIFYEGNDNSYRAPIVILVDGISVSGAELFPATLQAHNRATIIGETTPGAVMGGSLELITDSLAMVYPTLIVKTMEGKDLEGVGVKPDIVVTYDYEKVKQGIDAQLESALEHLRSL